MNIYAIVEASSEVNALDQATEVFEPLIGEKREPGTVFDGLQLYTQTDNEDARQSGSEDLPAAAPVDSDVGQELLERGLEATKEKFERTIEDARDALDNLSVEEIQQNKDSARQTFHRLSATKGPMIFLYHEQGGIRHRKQLEKLLDNSDELWIVPANVHY